MKEICSSKGSSTKSALQDLTFIILNQEQCLYLKSRAMEVEYQDTFELFLNYMQ